MRRLLVPLLLLLLGLPPAAAAQESQQGRLRILLDGQPIGSERYEIARTATEVHARGEIELQLGPDKLRQTSSLLLSADLAPRSYESKMEAPEKTWRRVEFAGGDATIVFPRSDGKEEEQVFKFGTPRVALLGLYHHFLLLAQLYDYAAAGPQTIKVFIPQSVQPGEARVELVGVETLTVDGRLQPVRQLSVTTEDNQVQLWVTESGRFVRLAAPREKVEVVPESAAP